MFNSRQQWLMIPVCFFGIFCLWRTSIWGTPSVLTSTSIQLDLSLPAPTILSQRVFNISKKISKISKRRHRGAASRYMLQLYHRRPSADIVRALSPFHVSGPIEYSGGGRIMEFQLPPVNPEEYLEAAELLGTAGMILRVRSIDNDITANEMKATRKDQTWRAFDVTQVVKTRKDDSVKLLVRGRVKGQFEEAPILLLSYTKPKKRKIRSAEDEVDDPLGPAWPMEGRRRRKNPCRRRPLYVDFSTINYDEWIVAPPGYDAYQCMGKCFFPFADHLSPTKHAIVQALVHGALQGADSGKSIGKVCCVPTRLAPTSLLYMDSSGTLTYQYGYEDMVVVECGCR